MQCGLSRTVSAEEVNPSPVVCAADAIGLSRTLEIDTTQGPLLGGKAGDGSLLADGEVVLTFEDGPVRPHTAAVLATLDRHCTKATFLLIGRQARTEPDLVREIARRGHTIGTHTYSHDSARLAGRVRAKADAELGSSIISRELGRTAAPLFRFPNADTPDTTAVYIRSRQVALVLGDIDPNDVQRKDAEAVRASVLKQLAAKRKGIVVLRDTVPATVEVLDALLTEIKTRGFRVVHLRPRTLLVTLAEFDAIAEAVGTGAEIGDPLARQFAWPEDSAVPPRKAVPKVSDKITTPTPPKAAELPRAPQNAAQPNPPAAPTLDDWVSGLYRSIIKALPPAVDQ
jgi:peptidoglycan/xylan/chitin deacetylase (PgdA/CDA1 family)